MLLGSGGVAHSLFVRAGARRILPLNLPEHKTASLFLFSTRQKLGSPFIFWKSPHHSKNSPEPRALTYSDKMIKSHNYDHRSSREINTAPNLSYIPEDEAYALEKSLASTCEMKHRINLCTI